MHLISLHWCNKIYTKSCSTAIKLTVFIYLDIIVTQYLLLEKKILIYKNNYDCNTEEQKQKQQHTLKKCNDNKI